MAPTAPSTKKRTSIRAKAAKSTSSVYTPPVHRPEAQISDSFISSKKDKRTIKHSAFVNRIEKALKKPLKRRRPNKKLVTTLESLADALPDIADGRNETEVGQVIKQKSLKSRPGALKRKEKMERVERERFGKNLAQLSAGGTGGAQKTESTEEGDKVTQAATANKWAVLRGFISQTLEQKPEFVKK